jgi:hypothetical protein
LKNSITAEPVQEGFLDIPYNFGTNHVYNLSTRLFHEYKSDFSVAQPQTSQITGKDLQNLLEASEKLQLINEITPIQLWALVCKLNSMQPIGSARVTAMFEDLAAYSYCNSFGAVLNKATVKAALEHYLGWSHG